VNNSTRNSKTNRWIGRTLTLTASVMTILLLVGCGSTKIYNNDKIIVYRGSTYNVSSVKQISAKNTGKLADGTTVNLLNTNRKQVEAYLKKMVQFM